MFSPPSSPLAFCVYTIHTLHCAHTLSVMYTHLPYPLPLAHLPFVPNMTLLSKYQWNNPLIFRTSINYIIIIVQKHFLDR